MRSNSINLKLISSILLGAFSHASYAASEIDIQTSAIPVTANPLGVSSDELVVPVAVMNGRDLSLNRESTLGETLKRIPGVNSSNFGPNASRPIIRGLDGDRVRIMQNGVGVLDASALSPDHAVAVDPFIAEQVEVVRGPATVLYGAGAIGGVVNVIDHRIPKEPLDGIAARGELRFGGADDQKNGVAVVDVGNDVIAVHADVYRRKSNDLDVPGHAKIRSRRGADDKRGTLVNSASESDGGALGASLTFENGYIGASYSNFYNNYGTVAEEDVTIKMDSDRFEFSGEARELGSIIKRVKFRMAHTDYEHQEIEGGEVGTTFKNRGSEGTLELAHGDIGTMKGVVGFQFRNSDFEAIGDEAFVPKSKTNSKGIYVYEELPLDALKLSIGGRVDRTKVNSKGGGNFGQGQSKKFSPSNLATGALYSIDEHWSIGSNFTHTERAPTQNELFANGPHLATGQFEVGDTNLSEERSNGLDAQIRWKSGKNSFSISGFYTRFSNFISLANTANTRGTDGELNPIDADNDGTADISGEDILQEAAINAVPAVFKGFEAQSKFRVYEGKGDADLSLRADYVRATNRDTGKTLPRIAPMRLGVGLDYKLGQFGSRLDVLHGFAQNRNAANETETGSYTSVDATVTYRFKSQFGLEAFAKAKNLLNDEIRDHTSFLKDIAPMGSRSLLIGLRGEF